METGCLGRIARFDQFANEVIRIITDDTAGHPGPHELGIRSFKPRARSDEVVGDSRIASVHVKPASRQQDREHHRDLAHAGYVLTSGEQGHGFPRPAQSCRQSPLRSARQIELHGALGRPTLFKNTTRKTSN